MLLSDRVSNNCMLASSDVNADCAIKCDGSL